MIPEGVAAVYANVGKHHDDEHDEGHEHHAHNNAAYIGMALLAGFVLM